MEVYGRNGKGVFGMKNRGKQTALLMMAACVSMLLVFTWEVSPMNVVSADDLRRTSSRSVPGGVTLGMPRQKAFPDHLSATKEDSSVYTGYVSIPVVGNKDDTESRGDNMISRQGSSARCDYSIGEWVPDNSRPFYSGEECTMWLASGFSCRLNNRPDMSYENFRWQPSGCDMPLFDGQRFLTMFTNKVLAFVGDSLGRQQLQSLLCMLTKGKNDTLISDVGSEFGFYIPVGDRKPTGFAYRFEETNTTIVLYWSVTLNNVEPLNETDPFSRNRLHLDRPANFLEDSIQQLDIIILNSGHHWNRGKMQLNRYDLHYKGVPVGPKEPLYRMDNARNLSIHSVVHWLSKQIENTDKRAFYRTLSPRHFRGGDWNTGGTCDNNVFDKDVKVKEGDPVDALAESATRGTNVQLLNITSLSLSRGEAHVSKWGGNSAGQDCLHWCMPGVPDTWNEVLFAMLSPPIFRKSAQDSSSEW